jgi:hypothetical protein
MVRPPPPSNRTRNVILALVALPLACGGCGLLAYAYVRSELGYGEAVERATNDARVKALLGDPVEAEFGFSGRGKGQSDNGAAVMSIRLNGSQQSGTLLSSGVKTSGVWGFSKLEVTADDGKRVSLVKE